MDDIQVREVHRIQDLGLDVAASQRSLCGLWRSPVPERKPMLFPHRYHRRDSWIEAFQRYGYTTDDRRDRRPWGPLTLYRGAPLDTFDGLAWTTSPELAAVFAFYPAYLPTMSPMGQLWTITVEPEQLLARLVHRVHRNVRRYFPPALHEYVVDTWSDCRPTPVEDERWRDHVHTMLTPEPGDYRKPLVVAFNRMREIGFATGDTL